MKVVLIGTTADCVLGFRFSLIMDLISQGHEVYAFANDYSDQQIQYLRSYGVSPIKYNLSRSSLNFLRDIKILFDLKNHLQRLKPDVVLSYFVKPVIYGNIAARLANIPNRIILLEGLGYVYTPDKNGFGPKKRILQIALGLLFTLSFSFASTLLFLNKDDPKSLSTFTKYNSDKVKILGGIGIDLINFPYAKPNLDRPVRFIFIGRLLAEKGIFELLEATKLVKSKYRDIELVILGAIDEDNPASLTQKDIERLEDQKIAIYPGQVSNVLPWINEAHVFVLPSYREGLPRSTQEAMAVGRPILTTDVPGCRETVIECRNGFIVPPYNAEKLAEKMIWFIENPQQIVLMGFESRTIAEQVFSAQNVNAKIIKIMGLT